MIVKNEAHVIEKTLENLLNYIQFTYYVISDTGSTDNTKELIKNFFDSKNIKGEIHDDEWKDFGHNRTLALQKAYMKTKYLFIFDADDRINGNFILPEILNKDSYHFKFGNFISYKRILLINNHLKWIFKGVLHEFIICTDKNKLIDDYIDGDYYIDSGKTGSRSQNPDKYNNDAAVLEKAFYKAVEENDDLKIRYSFYCAQSYRDAGNIEKAIEWYKKRVELQNWPQEVYFSYLWIGNLYYSMKKIQDAIYYWTMSLDADNERYEAIYRIINHFRTTGKTRIAYNYYLMIRDTHNKYINNKTTNFFENKLFCDTSVYNHNLDYELSIILCYNNNFHDAENVYYRLFKNKSIQYHILLNILENFIFYYSKINYSLDFIETFLDFIKYINIQNKKNNKNNTFTDKQIDVINKTVSYIQNKDISYHVESVKNNILMKADNNNNHNHNIFLTITTCKRFDLFTKTMDSFLTYCKDIHLITTFFCVDDNSSKEDRNNMKLKYPFFEFYFKSISEKGHLNSMNIIWNKLNESNPDYWIHLEDDWQFIKPENYVQKSIDFLKRNDSNNIHQILFNKNYGETIDSYNLIGGEEIDNEFLLHIKDEEGIKGRHCAYWNHYSFRPSMCKTDTILKLGNYDTDKTFFEGEYASKYYSAGYKSAFFNEITCIHIGKLTDDKSSKNAYTLNNEKQFGHENIVKDEVEVEDKNKTVYNYIFIKNKDHIGNDIASKGRHSIDDLIKYSNNMNDCIGFNTLGYFKNQINFKKLESTPFFGEEDGLYINIERYIEKYGHENFPFAKVTRNENKIYKIKDISIQFIKDYIYILNHTFANNDNDIEYLENKDINELFSLCDNNEQSFGFTTDGYLKGNINIHNLIYDKSCNKGVFIKLNKLKGRNQYMKFQNIDNLDDNINIQFQQNVNEDSLFDFIEKNEGINEYISFNSRGLFKKTFDLEKVVDVLPEYNHTTYINLCELKNIVT